MEPLMKADIFFFITTIAVIVVSAVLVAVLIYFLLILIDILGLVKHVKKEGEEIVKDVHDFRSNLKEEGGFLTSKWRALLSLILPGNKKRAKRNHSKTAREKTEPSE